MFKLYALSISNYKSFGLEPERLTFQSNKLALFGKNNAGKSNIISAIDILIGNREPKYIRLDQSDFNNKSKQIMIELTIFCTDIGDIYELKSLALKHKEKFYNDYKKSKSPVITLRFCQSIDQTQDDDDEQTPDKTDEKTEKEEKFTMEVAGLRVYQKIPIIRSQLIRHITAVPTRSVNNELNASKWTTYGSLMKTVLENSPSYPEIVSALTNINTLMVSALESERISLLQTSKTLTYIDDIKFQLTKENKPSELLRNLEILVSENDFFIPIEDLGTGTQSAVIIGILELALHSKSTQTKCFIVEEPELFLHPSGIRYLSQVFGRFTESNINQIILTTHSPLLLSSFDPIQIVRIDKSSGVSTIIQLPSDFNDQDFKISRIINSKNAEMFFADLVLLVEGESDDILFSRISEIVKDSNGHSCNFHKKNICVVNMGSKTCLCAFVKILDHFKIKFKAIVDKDFLSIKSHYSPLCIHLGIKPEQELTILRKSLSEYGICVLNCGEIEDLIPDEDTAIIANISVEDVVSFKAQYPNKTSDAFEKKIFKKSKPEYAYQIADYYIEPKNTPFDRLIHWIVN